MILAIRIFREILYSLKVVAVTRKPGMPFGTLVAASVFGNNSWVNPFKGTTSQKQNKKIG
jgi:hypothetical protein